MKLLTFTIPCYNSQDYMRHCIESILPGGEDVEILIVDDGSKDDTLRLQMNMPKNTNDCKSNSSGERGTWRSCECGNPQCNRFIF